MGSEVFGDEQEVKGVHVYIEEGGGCFGNLGEAGKEG
jgi:hypothetical protein